MASEGVLATLQAGWQALGTCGAERAVIGGLALSAWNHARYTRDADVLIAIDRGRIDELVQSLTAAGFHPRHQPPLRWIDGQGIIQFLFQPEGALMPFQFDVLLAGSDFHREAVARAVDRRLPGGRLPVRVVQPDDLIVIKLLAGRIIDLADAAMVLRENRDAIDVSRLERSVVELGLTADYQRSRQDAFPGEADPPAVR